ncbi:hypothetical protein DICVIV_13635 [Dictyocaulus viviparus]|uniref:Piwi domain-containing protein n=1 Tax=Dictyocaulus viviparus TaxID=29172 RepID=A0A0D8X9V2_DICVI|nr:hypothetical protein DICVIV_13635 [Dictyocaulus viviparus]
MMGSKFANVVVEIIERHRVAAPTAPRDFIFYFSGISEGQFGMIPDCYMCPISNRLSLLTPLYAASVTALGASNNIIVSRLHRWALTDVSETLPTFCKLPAQSQHFNVSFLTDCWLRLVHSRPNESHSLTTVTQFPLNGISHHRMVALHFECAGVVSKPISRHYRF